MTPQSLFDALSERLERFLSTWWGVTTYTAMMALSGLLWGWDGIDRALFITGSIILVLLIGSGRRDSKAAQAKLDRLLPGHDLDRLEDRCEEEIEAARP